MVDPPVHPGHENRCGCGCTVAQDTHARAQRPYPLRFASVHDACVASCTRRSPSCPPFRRQVPRRLRPPPPPGMTPPPGLAAATDAPYPARLQIDYPETLNRVTTAFRIILIIPIGIVLSILTNSGSTVVETDDGEWVTTSGTSILGALFFTTLLMILFRQRYPKWWYDFALELNRFGARVLRLLRTPHRHLSVDRRHPERPSRHRLPRECRAGPEQMAAARQVVPGHPSLHHLVLPVDRGVLLRGHRLVRDPLHREVSEGSVRLRRRRRPLEPAGVCVRVPPRDRPLSPVRARLSADAARPHDHRRPRW